MKVSLVLSGGGARGYAHIGVIETLLSHGFEIVSISGTSMGAIVGGCYAAGVLDEYREWLLGLDIAKMAKFLDFNIKKPSDGLLKGEKAYQIIKEIVGERHIEELPIKFTAVATNLTKGREVWLQSGSLWEALRATSAVPGFFSPVIKEGQILVDGGVLNTVPIGPTMTDNSDMTLVVNVNADVDHRYEVIESPKQKLITQQLEKMWNKVFDFANEDIKTMALICMMDIIDRYKMAGYKSDMIINISKESCGMFDFHRANEMIEVGKMATRDRLQKKGLI